MRGIAGFRGLERVRTNVYITVFIGFIAFLPGSHFFWL